MPILTLICFGITTLNIKYSVAAYGCSSKTEVAANNFSNTYFVPLIRI